MEHPYIHSDPNIMMGKPVIKGTCITVEAILDRLAVGETATDLLAAFPRFTTTAIFASLAFAVDALRADMSSFSGIR